jgi:hypothetical protein
VDGHERDAHRHSSVAGRGRLNIDAVVALPGICEFELGEPGRALRGHVGAQAGFAEGSTAAV